MPALHTTQSPSRRRLPRLTRLVAGTAVAVAAALIAAACIANADNDATPDDEPSPAPAAETTTSSTSTPTAAPAEPATTTAAPQQQASRPAPPAAVAGSRPIANTPRKDLAVGAAAAENVQLAKSFYTFSDFAALDFSPELFVAWGIGAPRGEYVISASVWRDGERGAERLSSAELPSGGSLRSGDAIRVVDGATAQRAWLEAFGETGAHGVTYDLLLWNGRELVAVIGHFTSAPGNVVAPGAAAALRDLNGDGVSELVIDRTDPYLFHYTSQVWQADAAVLRREGDAFREVELSLPAASVGDDAMASAHASLAFAEEGWWRYALEHAQEAARLAPDSESLAWNAIVIAERGGAALREAERSAVAWLGALLAGDWGEAVQQMYAVPTRRWLELDRVLRDTPLAGSETSVAQLVEQRATVALEAADRLPVHHVAPAWLMRGLARWWLNGEMIPTAIDLVEAIPGYWRETLVFDLLWAIGYREG